jgi:hypothetical protein
MKSMRIIHFLLFCVFAFATGCATRSGTQGQGNAVMVLDNKGGFSHAGRRLELHRDNTYRDTAYTDVRGEEILKTGRYTLDPKRRHLTLSPERGSVAHLYRVDYSGQQYWVREDERERIAEPGEASLRQFSLRLVR